jgi:GalNAc-alpha-(1->4)-GalNAc-alpha-(1->3)-diNAcBac-PP-undecaprenol alpha-1,4-N-acetyl-D-galactosaminyltransferase
MARGAPVVCTDCPSGPNEIISQRESSLLVPPDDLAALADAILEVLNKRALRIKCVRAAAQKIARHYAIGKIMDAYLPLLLEPSNRTEYD